MCILFLLFFMLFCSDLMASDRGDCYSYASAYGANAFYDLNNQPILNDIKDDLARSNLLGNLDSFDPPQNGILRVFYKNGDIFMVEPFSNGMPNGVKKFFYKTGDILAKIPYENGVISGSVFVFHKNGNLKMKAVFQNGEIVGDALMFHSNGNLSLKETYVSGKRHGQQLQYYDDGETLQSSIPYQNGLISGTARLFYNSSLPLAILEFKNNQLLSNVCFTKRNVPSKLNGIEIFKLFNGMRPIFCTSKNEPGDY